MFCFKNICIEKLAGRLFKAIFVVMAAMFVLSVIELTGNLNTHAISASMYAYTIIYSLIYYILGLGIFRMLLEVPVVLHKILNALLENKSKCGME